MLTRRELIRRVLGLPLVAGLAAVVGRKRGGVDLLAVLADGGAVVYDCGPPFRYEVWAPQRVTGTIDTLFTYRGRPIVYANSKRLPAS